MALKIIYSHWKRTKGPWQCLMTTLFLFISFVFLCSHISHFTDKTYSLTKVFHRQKADWGHGVGGISLHFSVTWAPDWFTQRTLDSEIETQCVWNVGGKNSVAYHTIGWKLSGGVIRFQASSPAHVTRQQVPNLRINQMFILWRNKSGKTLKSQDLVKGEHVMPFKKQKNSLKFYILSGENSLFLSHRILGTGFSPEKLANLKIKIKKNCRHWQL